MTRQWRLFEESAGRLHLYLGVFKWKVQRFCWSQGTSLEYVESIYVKTTGTACVSEGEKKKKIDKSYRACMRPFGYFKHVNSLSSGQLAT